MRLAAEELKKSGIKYGSYYWTADDHPVNFKNAYCLFINSDWSYKMEAKAKTSSYIARCVREK